MGIKHLWTILTPFCERKPLYELQGKIVAIDLSCWICEAQNIAEYQVQPRMYLRNLYFRTCYLLLMDVIPVFVLEGKAPELKYDTIAARNAIQFKGAKPKTDGVKTGKDRSRFNFVLKSCEEMLAHMGLVCIKGKGEAESLCAYLNDEGLVHGCISQDSDCFAYGAKVVYRNFSIASQGAYSASGGAVDIYDISKAFESLKFGRNKIIAMALLSGSDYSEGVQGIGKESVLKFFETLSDEEVLDRLRSWKNNHEKYEKFENLISDKNICTSCGHAGKLQSHSKKGCSLCSTTVGCDPFKFKEERLRIKNELNMRNKALLNPNFPDERLISEYLVKKDNVSSLNLKWKQPNLAGFVHFTTKFLQWEEIYAFEKMLPILTRWQCLNYNLVGMGNHKGVLHPSFIKKSRNPKGIPSYEIIWTDPDDNFKGLIPEEVIQEKHVDIEKLWSTVEPQVLIKKAYPKLVEEFEQSKIKPKKINKRKKKVSEIDEIDVLMKNTSISESAPKKIRRRKKDIVEKKVLKDLDGFSNTVSLPKKNVTPLENFLKTAVLNRQHQKSEHDAILFDKCQLQTSTPTKAQDNHHFNVTHFSDEEDDLDLSNIVESIISKKPDYIEENLKKILPKLDIYEEVPNHNSVSYCNSSSFFIKNAVENDLFEQTFNAKDDSGESTEEYDVEEVECLKSGKETLQPLTAIVTENKENSGDDSFCDVYVPLLERVRNK